MHVDAQSVNPSYTKQCTFRERSNWDGVEGSGMIRGLAGVGGLRANVREVADGTQLQN